MNQFKKYLNIQKVDADQRMVYGFASTSDLDSDGEIISVEALKKAMPEYMKFPSLREMHQPKVAGTVKEAQIKQKGATEGMWIGAKVVADDAWNLVKEGAYTAFSIGGNILEKVGNTITALELIEVSLVDVPANKAAVIEVWKNKGMDKNATGVSVLTWLMNDIREAQMIWQQQGKKTKLLDKMLEQVKSLISEEALEPEQTGEKARKMADALALLLSKGGESNMKQKSEENKEIEKVDLKELNADEAEAAKQAVEKAEQAKADNKEDSANADEAKGEKESADKVEGEKTEGEGEKAGTETEGENKEASADVATQKLEEANKALDKVAEKKEQPVEKMDLAKTVTAMASTVAKMADQMVKMQEEIKKLGETPAAAKSKSAAFVEKSSEQTETKEDKTEKNAELETKKAKLAELNKAYDELGPAEFAKSGKSMEAMKLMGEIDALEKKAK